MWKEVNWVAPCVTAVAVLAACADRAEIPPVLADDIRRHAETLASDAYMGRGPGQRGGDMAVDYIRSRFEEYGLEAPGGSYTQSVPMLGNAPSPESATLEFVGARGGVRPTYLDDFVLNPGDAEATSAAGEAELVFVGYGISAPENEWDDFAGVDVAGKYILILVNDPPAPAAEPTLFGGEAMTYYGRWTYKYEEAARQGALGALIVHETEPASYPWTVVRNGFSGEQFALPRGATEPAPPTLIGWVSVDLARELLAAGGHDFDGLKARAGARGFTAVETGITVRGSVESSVRQVDTENVVGLLRGSERTDEYLLVTAHYDGFGVGAPIDGDSIYNGAYDNASGTAQILAMARALSTMDPGPERSVLFIAAAAEEQGLLGAELYVQDPLFPLSQTVALLNFDEANVWGLTSDVTLMGEERSELGPYGRAAVEAFGLTLLPDAEPAAGMYFRSDHFPFARAGVPALNFKHGWRFVGKPDGWGDSVRVDYNAVRYHQPSDEVLDEFTYDGAARDADLALRILVDLAATDTWPNWLPGQEFKAARDAMMATGR
jgi:Zn-dependent M28 family amino/carboxypeptidase